MSATGLNVFDRTLQTTHIWIDEIMAEIGPSRRTAWHVLGVVLRTIRDRVPLELAVHLGAQLPLLVRGAYYEQFCPGSEAERFRSVDDFVERIADGLEGGRPVNCLDAAGAVFRVLSRHVDEGQIAKVKQSLPEPLRRLWNEADEGIEGPEARAEAERRDSARHDREEELAEAAEVPNFLTAGL